MSKTKATNPIGWLVHGFSADGEPFWQHRPEHTAHTEHHVRKVCWRLVLKSAPRRLPAVCRGINHFMGCRTSATGPLPALRSARAGRIIQLKTSRPVLPSSTAAAIGVRRCIRPNLNYVPRCAGRSSPHFGVKGEGIIKIESQIAAVEAPDAPGMNARKDGLLIMFRILLPRREGVREGAAVWQVP